MWAFITPKEYPNVSLLLKLLWLQSVDVKLFIHKKEIHIKDTKKGEEVFQILFLTTTSENTHF